MYDDLPKNCITVQHLYYVVPNIEHNLAPRDTNVFIKVDPKSIDIIGAECDTQEQYRMAAFMSPDRLPYIVSRFRESGFGYCVRQMGRTVEEAITALPKSYQDKSLPIKYSNVFIQTLKKASMLLIYEIDPFDLLKIQTRYIENRDHMEVRDLEELCNIQLLSTPICAYSIKTSTYGRSLEWEVHTPIFTDPDLRERFKLITRSETVTILCD